MGSQRLKILAFLFMISSIVTVDPFSWFHVSDDEMEPAFLHHPEKPFLYHSPQPSPPFESAHSTVKVHSAVLSFRVNSSGGLVADPMLGPHYSTHLKHVVAKIPDVVRL
jgi:hypothetical protein